jgi:signal peptidase I
VWFTDPAYGIGGNYEGVKSPQEQEKHNVYRADPKSGDIKVVVDDFVERNGLAFSPDEKKLYVIDTGFTDGPDNPSHLRVFDVDHWNSRKVEFSEDFVKNRSCMMGGFESGRRAAAKIMSTFILPVQTIINRRRFDGHVLPIIRAA